MEAFQSLLQEHKAAAQEIEYGEASSQAVMEGLAIFRALQLWSKKRQGGPVVIRSDSSVALAMARKISSLNRILNYLASEIALSMKQKWAV